MSNIREDGTFDFWFPATIQKGEDGKMYVSGIASTEDEDLQGEKIKQEGIDLSYFLKRGFLNDDHSKETAGKVGIPTEAVVTRKGLWIKGFLLDTPRAKGIWDLAQALEKSGSERKLGYSVEGKVLARDQKNPRIITKCWLKDIAITASPINPKTFLDIAKSFAGTDCTEIFVEGDTETEAVEKGQKKEKKEKTDETSVLDALEDATKQPVEDQRKAEDKDAKETAQEALSEKNPKEDVEKELDDVPIAKKPTMKAAKSVESGDLEKGFKKVNEMGGEREFGDKKMPVHVTTYKHKKGHHIIVTSKDGAHAVTHMHKDPDKECDTEILGAHLFHDDPDKGIRGDDAADAHLRGFGINHKYADKKKHLGKAIVNANDDSNDCEICKANISKGELFVVCDGHSFCGEDCIEKALVAGYQFAKLDQTGGSALRVESLEGATRDNGYGSSSEIRTKVKEVKFDTAKANGGTVHVTLKDALDFLVSRGYSEDMADRILVLMVKNDGDITKLAQKANGGK